MSNKKPFLVGISGGSGCGKTTVLKALFDSMPQGSIALVSQDDYYRSIECQPKDENGKENFDLPVSIDHESFVKDLNNLLAGEKVVKDEYTFNNESNAGTIKTINAAPIVIVEGLFVFHFKEIMELINLKVFVEACEDTRLERRIRRDDEERGYPEEEVLYQWKNHVKPAYDKFLEPYIEHCDLIIDNNSHYEKDVQKLVEVLKKKL